MLQQKSRRRACWYELDITSGWFSFKRLNSVHVCAVWPDSGFYHTTSGFAVRRLFFKQINVNNGRIIIKLGIMLTFVLIL